MEIVAFSKKRKNSEGGTFMTYITSIPKKDGTKQTMNLKFKEDCPKPKPAECPMYINVNKENANISKSTYKRRDTGEENTSYTLWVGAWEKSERVFRDDSLDEFQFE